MSKRLEEELKERLHTRKLEKKNDGSVVSGCINNGYFYTIDDEQNIFVKINATLQAQIMFDGELESLKQIQSTRTIRVPKPLFVIHNYDKSQASAIVMEYLNISRSLSSECAQKLGQNLANLHDYNNKVLTYNRKACKWIGGKPPSAKAIIEQKQKQHDKNEYDNNERKGESEEEEEESQFTKHSMRFKNTTNLTTKHASSKLATQYPDKFVPEPNTEEIKQFGFNIPTSCGLIPQVNEWTDDWVSFYARHRLDKAIRALLSDHGDRELSEQWAHLQLKVDKFFSDFDPTSDDNKIVPALLHGDLWSGNVAQLLSDTTHKNDDDDDDNEPAIYDPASFYGHSEYDFGIARMFGGIPKAFEATYFETIPKKKLFEKRNKLYQLFHHLNHWDHFGSGYRPSSLRIIKDLNALV